MSIPRDINAAAKNGGWFWAENSVLDKIVADIPGAHPLVSVYTALCLIASKESKRAGSQVSSFRAGLGRIANQAGACRQSVVTWLRRLEEADFIEVEHVLQRESNAEDMLPNKYTLLPIAEVERRQRERSNE